MRRVIAIAISFALFGCATEPEPPWAELELRDVLLADAATLEALPLERRRELAERFEDERRAQRGGDRLLPLGAIETAAAVAVADEARLEAGEDAWIAIEAHADATALEVQVIPAFAGADGGVAAAPDVELRWASEPEGTAAVAIAGRAGEVVREAAALTGPALARLEPGLHAAIASDGETILVSPSWLAVMAALEPGATVAPPPSTPASSGEVAVATEALLSGSPYSLASIAECTADVTGRCATCLTGGSCRGSPTLSDFGTVRAECELLAEDSSRAEALCVLGMLSVSSVRSCVRRTWSCPPVPLDRTAASLTAAATFVADPGCRDALDRCASDRTPPQNCDASCDPDCGLSCSDTFSGCSACADATTSTADSCSDSCDSLFDCGDRCDRCEVRGARRSSPLGGLAVLIPPLVALAMLRRRRSSSDETERIARRRARQERSAR